MKCLKVLAFLLVLIGAINWGLWGFFQFDLVAWLFHGNTTWMSRFVYSIVGLSGVWCLSLIPRCKHVCCGSSCGCCEKCGKKM
ncbi:MAG: DUF378 domain-containing protein [Verrucomicrobia bacterium]|nr:DUF378 domain-containing protein [Verrucomicrobiota bacterium]